MSTTTEQITVSQPKQGWKLPVLVIALAVMWWLLYGQLQNIADWITYTVLGLSPLSHLGQSVNFFFYDVPKILMLLSGMIFLITMIRSFFSAEQARAALGGKREGVGNVLAASLGVITPFCSCSAVPLFIGFVESGVPLGVTFSFLIAAPMVNEIALAMLFGMFGWQIAGLYMVSGLIIAILGGMLIGRLKPERHVEDFVWQIKVGPQTGITYKPTWDDRIRDAGRSTKEIVSKVWPYVILGIAIGAAIHGFVPESYLADIMGRSSWWAVPAAVLLGIPLYSNAAGIIPVVSALVAKGAALGTVLAFMMSVVALSLPEMLILKRVIKTPLIVMFITIVGTAIIFTGYLFNFIVR
ncbi:MAG: permease [Anaerolineae bacterium]|nr:permease [Anaerolineae bacterium]